MLFPYELRKPQKKKGEKVPIKDLTRKAEKIHTIKKTIPLVLVKGPLLMGEGTREKKGGLLKREKNIEQRKGKKKGSRLCRRREGGSTELPLGKRLLLEGREEESSNRRTLATRKDLLRFSCDALSKRKRGKLSQKKRSVTPTTGEKKVSLVGKERVSY